MRRRSFALVAAFALVALLLSVPIASGAGRPSCLVSNDRTGFGARAVQAGVDAADSGDTLVIKGTCTGPSTIDKSLTLKGVSNPAFGRATLDGGHNGPVLSIVDLDRGAVSLRGLAISNGTGTEGGGINARNVGSLTIAESTVAGNEAESGGGIYAYGALVTIIDSAITGNVASARGGGIWVMGSLTLVESAVTDNAAGYGGGIYSHGSEVTIVDAAITGNTAGSGGGIASDHGRVAIGGTSSVDHNSASQHGGGILHVQSEFLTLKDQSSVHDNNAGQDGGGIWNGDAGVVLQDMSSVYANTAGGNGGGLFNDPFAHGSMTGESSITGNFAGGHGGGVYNEFLPGEQLYARTRLYEDSTVADNLPDDCYPFGTVVGCPV